MVIIQCIMALLMLSVSYGRTVPSSERQARGRTYPHRCSFFNRTVSCNSMQLSTMPSKLPVRTKVLILNDNIIETLDWTTLSKLTELEELHLQGNELKGVHWKDINLLPSLRLLDLSDNPIVCDCNMARLVNSDQESIARLKVQLGETRCAGPSTYAGGSARDVLLGMDCRQRRKRSEGESCYGIFCLHGGTCIEKDGEPICFCPSHYSGEKCEVRPLSGSGPGSSSSGSGLSILLEGIGPDFIKISWRTSSSYQVDYYEVSIGYDGQSSVPDLRITQMMYSFFGLRPGTRYEVCVTAYSEASEELSSSCEFYSTHPPPSGPETGPPSPPHHSSGPNKSGEEKDGEIIHQAAVILGSIIGVCFFFVILLTAVYKIRNLRNARSRQRRTSPTPPANTEAPSSPQSGPDDANSTTNQGREIIVLAVSSDSQTPEGEAGASSTETGIQIPATATTIPLNVLQALKQQGSRSQQGSGSANTVVLYHPDNIVGGECRTTSQENIAGSAPIFIVADGNSYPLDPTLSEVLRSAMAGRLPQQGPLPQDPPPPYSELAAVEETDPPQVPDNRNDEFDSSGNTHHNASPINTQDDTATSEL